MAIPRNSKIKTVVKRTVVAHNMRTTENETALNILRVSRKQEIIIANATLPTHAGKTAKA